jgi:hypothetical protein
MYSIFAGVRQVCYNHPEGEFTISNASLGGPNTEQPPATNSGLKSPREQISLLLVILLLLSAVGLAIAFKLPASIWLGLDSFFRFDFDPAHVSQRGTPLDTFDSPFPLFPLMLLVIWLLCAFGLLFFKNGKVISTFSSASVSFHPVVWLGSGLLPVLAGWFVRANQLLPGSSGIWPVSNYDEMVYFSAASQLAQGYWPYRDFFLAHPPGVLLVLAPLMKIFGEAGGSDAFAAARWFIVITGLVTVAATFRAASILWQREVRNLLLPGLTAGLLYALDVRVSQIAVLEVVSNLFAVFAFLLFLEALHRAKPNRFLLGAGGLAALAFLSKLPGLALIFALLVYLIWRRDWRGTGWLAAGFAGVSVLVSGLFALIAGPGQFLRQVVFFQVMRPQEVAEGRDQVGRLAEEAQSGLIFFVAGLVLLAISVRLARRKLANDLWLIPALWSLPLVATLLLGKSFHPWYYVQLALPLAIIGGGLFVIPKIKTDGFRRFMVISGLLLALIAGPLAVRQVLSGLNPPEDRVYQAAGTYLQNQPDTGAVLSFDPGFVFMSKRTPATLPDGKRLIDSAGYMVYLNLNIDRRGPGELFGQLFNLNRERDQVGAIFRQERAQAFVSAASTRAGWSAVDVKMGLAQLTPQALEFIQTVGAKATTIEYLDLYQARFATPVVNFSNGLCLYSAGPSSSFQGQANYDPVDGKKILKLPARESNTRVLDLRFVWEVRATPPQQVKVFVHLLNEQTGQRVTQRDILPLDGKADSRNWRKGDFYGDVHSLPLPAGLTPGRYRIIAGIYDVSGGQRIPLEDYNDTLTIGYLELT